jgi:DNA-binding NarL/FixJ family response regulator
VVRTSPARPIKADSVAAVLWDAGLAAEANTTELAAIQAAFPGAPIIALTDFLRIEQHKRLLAAGAAVVLSKPVMLAELLWQLDEVGGAERNGGCRAVSK